MTYPVSGNRPPFAPRARFVPADTLEPVADAPEMVLEDGTIITHLHGDVDGDGLRHSTCTADVMYG